MSTVWQNTTGALEFFPPPGWVGCCLPPAAAAALQLSPVARAPARVPRVVPLRAKTYLCKSGQVLFAQVWSSALQKNCANRQPIQATIGGGGRPRFPPCSLPQVQVSGRGCISRIFANHLHWRLPAIIFLFSNCQKFSFLTNYFFSCHHKHNAVWPALVKKFSWV